MQHGLGFVGCEIDVGCRAASLGVGLRDTLVEAPVRLAGSFACAFSLSHFYVQGCWQSASAIRGRRTWEQQAFRWWFP